MVTVKEINITFEQQQKTPTEPHLKTSTQKQQFQTRPPVRVLPALNPVRVARTKRRN